MARRRKPEDKFLNALQKQSPEEKVMRLEARAAKLRALVYPTQPRTGLPARTEQRICFGIMWFTSEEDATIAHETVRRQGRTINGGYFDGMPCGRAPEWDYVEDAVTYYAVTN